MWGLCVFFTYTDTKCVDCLCDGKSAQSEDCYSQSMGSCMEGFWQACPFKIDFFPPLFLCYFLESYLFWSIQLLASLLTWTARKIAKFTSSEVVSLEHSTVTGRGSTWLKPAQLLYFKFLSFKQHKVGMSLQQQQVLQYKNLALPDSWEHLFVSVISLAEIQSKKGEKKITV